MSDSKSNGKDLPEALIPNDELAKHEWWVAEVRDHLEIFIFRSGFDPNKVLSIAGVDEPKLGSQFLFCDRVIRLVPVPQQDSQGNVHQATAMVDFKMGAYVRVDTILLLRRLMETDGEYIQVMNRLNPSKIVHPTPGEVAATKISPVVKK